MGAGLSRREGGVRMGGGLREQEGRWRWWCMGRGERRGRGSGGVCVWGGGEGQ